jgi:hypothetical protein
MNPEHLRTIGVTASSASAGAAAIFWLTKYAGAGDPSSMSSAVALGMMAASVLAGIAALHSWLAIYLMFLIRFVPIGYYLLGAPSFVALVGMLDLIYLAGGIVVHRADLHDQGPVTRHG